MKRTYAFKTAKPLIAFYEKYKGRIIGQHIRAFYSLSPFGQLSDSPIVFELDDFSIVLSYFFYSDLTIYIVDKQMVHDDPTLSFLYIGCPENRSTWVNNRPFPFVDHVIADIHFKQFSHEFEINASSGDTRPAGGDYFSTITVELSGGSVFYICAADAEADGYVDTWMERPHTSNRDKLLSALLSRGLTNAELSEIVKPMSGKTQYEKEQIAVERE